MFGFVQIASPCVDEDEVVEGVGIDLKSVQDIGEGQALRLLECEGPTLHYV
jgi:hypothetical protein